MRKRIISLIVTIGLATTISMPVFADPLSDNFRSQNNELENVQISIEKLDSNIEKIYAELDKAKVKMGETEKKIQQSTKDIQGAEESIKDEEDLFNKRMRIMYMNGVDSYLEVLLDSEGIVDFISRVENIKKIVEYDNKIIGELTDKKDEIENQRAKLETEKTNLVLLTTANEDKMDSLKDKKQAQEILITEAKSQPQLYASAGQAYVNAANKQIKQISNNASKYTPSRGASALSSNSIIAYASNFLGTKYAWGGNGPSSFDCSGFVKYVYAHFGVSMGRTTTTQVNEGSYVAKGNLQPGDLIFFGSSSNPHHVGMYVGNNSYIHAPSTGDVVKISALTRRDYLTARRFK
ncbi:C40 family peptidase [Clostridium sp.]|uniref:C40 family peptidase n=1 Tax=Clostridium sp. TaxID=1506 RepID=UPI001A62BF8A|nr:C40 family peptidase [Clostridium sp.]MBK5236214.1 C40 family peptidase [Clostridium sp.]